MQSFLARTGLVGALAAVVNAPITAHGQLPRASRAAGYDVILRGGTVVDGTGGPMYRADVAVRGGHIVRIGNLTGVSATTDLDVRGLLVAPGFINIHSHAVASVLPTAENMLTQGVTTELLNADGAGPLDIGAQLDGLMRNGLAVNVAASAGFNSVWAAVMGPSDRRPNGDDMARMQAMIIANLERGAFGVSAGLDYKPAYFSTVGEAIQVLSPARPWRTFFPNHDRLAPEFGYSSRHGMEETMAIGEGAGLVPVFTHMKVQGREQGTATAVLAMMRRATAAGHWVAADVYPYLAGQTALAALIIPGWAQDGGVTRMRERFADPVLRARIVRESDDAISARFNGAGGITLNESGRKLSDIMLQQRASSPGEVVVKVLETEYPSAILSFGAEDDLRKILQDPAAAIACDCGAWTELRAHPRGYGTFPRILGHYVRELHTLTWEQAVRKMTALPAAISGMVDRGLIAPGMAADIAVFDSATVIDHATYDAPSLKSEGIRVVLVNGVVALRDGAPTGARGGAALRRSGHMPTRELRLDARRDVHVTGTLRAGEQLVAKRVVVDVRQSAGMRWATGQVRVVTAAGTSLRSVALGVIQPGPNWASLTGVFRDGPTERAFVLMIDGSDPLAAGTPRSIELHVEGMARMSGTLTGRMEIRGR